MVCSGNRARIPVKLTLVVMTTILVAVLLVPGTWAGNPADQIEFLKGQVAVLKQRMADLESQRAVPAPAFKMPGNLSFHGYFRCRFHNSTVDSEPGTFEATELTFHPRWDVTDRIHGETHIWFWPSAGGIGNTNNYIESAMAIFDGVGLTESSQLIVGKTRNWAYGITPTGGGRLLSNYSLYSDSFHHDRVYGLQVLNKMDDGKIDLNLAVINGYKVGIRTTGVALLNFDVGAPGDGLGGRGSLGDTTLVLANRENGFDGDNNKAVSLRVGGICTGNLTAGVSAYMSRISEADAAALAGYGFAATGRRHTMLGGDFRFRDGQWIWQGEYTSARLAGNGYDGYQSVIGCDVSGKDTVYLQYGQVDYDGAAAADTRTWDKQQLAVSWKHRLAKKSWLQLEHEINSEDPPDGVPGKDNDLTFLELFVGF